MPYYAVLESGEVCEIPESRDKALALKYSGQRFWCSDEAGGCGEEMTVAAGRVMAPYFRHRPGSRCEYAQGSAEVYAREQERYGDLLTHRLMQESLQSWIESLGYQVSLERVSSDRESRTDLHAVVHGLAHSVEVQRSPIDQEIWEERNQRYLRDHDKVTWLWDPFSSDSYGIDLARGVEPLLIRAEKDRVQLGLLVYEPEELLHESLWLSATRAVWRDLDSWSLDESGLTPPQELKDEAQSLTDELASRSATRNEQDRRQAEAKSGPLYTICHSWPRELLRLTKGAAKRVDRPSVYGTVSIDGMALTMESLDALRPMRQGVPICIHCGKRIYRGDLRIMSCDGFDCRSFAATLTREQGFDQPDGKIMARCAWYIASLTHSSLLVRQVEDRAIEKGYLPPGAYSDVIHPSPSEERMLRAVQERWKDDPRFPDLI